MAINLGSEFVGKVGTATPDYPTGVPRNVSAPGAGDGTPWDEKLIKDFVGFRDAALLRAGLTANNLPETANSSQVLDGLRDYIVDEALQALNIDSIKDLGSIEKIDSAQYSVKGFYADTDVGGGLFYWDATRDKADHNVGGIIDPERIDAWDGTHADLATLFTVGSGFGCFVRLFNSNFCSTWFGIISSSTIDQLDYVKNAAKASIGRDFLLTVTDILFSNTFIVDDAYKGLRVIGNNPNGGDVIMHRNGVVDTWRACFHIDTSDTFLDRLFGVPAVDFSERCFVSYGLNAGKNNKFGTLRGKYWSRGVVYPKLTGKDFELDGDLIELYHGGRTYSSDFIDTPAGNVRIKKIRGIEGGFLDVSGGSLECDSVSWYRHNSNGMKKGSQQAGGVINIGSLTQIDSLGEIRLTVQEPGMPEQLELDEVITGQSSGATAKVHCRGRSYVDVYEVVGAFQNGESVVSASTNITLTVSDEPSSLGENITLDNAGVEFDEINIGSITCINHRGQPFAFRNGGTANIGTVLCKNLIDSRHIIRHSPNQGAGSADKGHCFVGTIDIQDSTFNESYVPFLYEGNADSYFEIGTLKVRNLKNGTTAGGGAPLGYFAFSSAAFTIGEVRMEDCSDCSRIFNQLGGKASKIKGGYLDVSCTRWATIASSATDISVAFLRHGGSSADGNTAELTLTDVSPI